MIGATIIARYALTELPDTQVANILNGSVTLAPVTLSGTGTVRFVSYLTGAITLDAATASGSVVAPATGLGSVTLNEAIGTSAMAVAVTGSSHATLDALTGFGAAHDPATASGSVVLDPLRGPVSFALTFRMDIATSASIVRKVTKPLTIAARSVVTMVRNAGKTARVNSATALTKTRAVAFITAIACVPSLLVRRRNSLSRALNSQGAVAHRVIIAARRLILPNSAIRVLKAPRKLVVIQLASLLFPRRRPNKVSAPRLMGAVQMRRAITAIKVLAAHGAIGIISHRIFGKFVAIGNRAALGIRRAVRSAHAAALTSHVGSVRRVAKSVAVASRSALRAAASHVFHLVLGIPISTAYRFARRGIVKPIGFALHGEIGMRRAITKMLRLRSFSGVGVSTSIAEAYRYARRIIGRATAAFIIGKADATVTTAASVPVSITGAATLTVHDPLDFLCGDTWELTGPLLDANGVALNLTGATVNWRLDPADGSATLISLGVGTGIAISDLPSATIFVQVPASQTLGIAPGAYRDWLTVTLANGTVLTEWTGVVRANARPA